MCNLQASVKPATHLAVWLHVPGLELVVASAELALSRTSTTALRMIYYFAYVQVRSMVGDGKEEKRVSPRPWLEVSETKHAYIIFFRPLPSVVGVMSVHTLPKKGAFPCSRPRIKVARHIAAIQW